MFLLIFNNQLKEFIFLNSLICIVEPALWVYGNLLLWVSSGMALLGVMLKGKCSHSHQENTKHHPWVRELVKLVGTHDLCDLSLHHPPPAPRAHCALWVFSSRFKELMNIPIDCGVLELRYFLKKPNILNAQNINYDI